MEVPFNEKANLRVGYRVVFPENNSNQNLFILAGIYTTFGAARVMGSNKEGIFNLSSDL